MAHFAELDDNNIVLRVIVVSNEDAGPLPGLQGEAFCHELLGGRWKQTSYNTRGGVHYDSNNQPDGGVAFRKNYAGIGYTYDDMRDAFIPPSPYPSWVLNEDTYYWEPPIPRPTEPAPDGYYYEWSEAAAGWVLVAFTSV